MDKHLFALRKDEVESLSVVRGDKKLDLARKESGFVMRSPVQGEVELETGNRRIEAIVLAEGELVLDAKAADLGLEPPTGKITLRSSAESDEAVVEETVEIGRVGKSGKLAVRRVADGMVLELDPDAARTLEADSTLIRGLRLLDFSGSDFRSLEVRGRSVKQTIHREASGQIVLDVPAGKSADTALTGDAIHELGRLTADRWVSDVEEPSFGLASPELTVEFSFATGDAGVKDRVLTVGASTAS